MEDFSANMKQLLQVISNYRQYLKLEKSLSLNTLDAYLLDLTKLTDYAKSINRSVLEITLQDLQGFLAELHDLGIHPRSQARILSGIKSFYHYLLLEELIENDPSRLLDGPKLGFHIPVFLSVEEIDAIVQAVDVSTPEGVRNRAILETLYSCGLRVSELTGLKISQLNFEDQYVVVDGKGSKQRLVPISERCIQLIKYYLTERGAVVIKRGAEDTLFLNRRGAGLSRVMIFNIVKKYAELAGISKNVSPHTFRHSFATHLLEGGANLRAIQAMLGHESITTTEIYTHLDKSLIRHEILEYHPRNK
jgi:integrase/recombinase XerD